MLFLHLGTERGANSNDGQGLKLWITTLWFRAQLMPTPYVPMRKGFHCSLFHCGANKEVISTRGAEYVGP